jgi:hypothetical protein
MDAAFYAYAAPEPEGLKSVEIKPDKAFYSREMLEFFLMYEDVRQAKNPEETLMDFLNSTYEAAANLAKWNRDELERN